MIRPEFNTTELNRSVLQYILRCSHSVHAMQHLTHLHEHHFLNDMGCMTGREQPAFLAYSTFFNISAASGAKQKVQGVVTSFSTKKVLREGGKSEE